jgi:hypothetical protein
VPQQVAVSIEHAAASRTLGPLLSDALRWVPDLYATALFVHCEASKSASNWKNYLDYAYHSVALSPTPPPLLWDEAWLNELGTGAGGGTIDEIRHRRAVVADVFSRIAAVLATVDHSMQDECMLPASFTLHAFATAIAVIQTRLHVVQIRHPVSRDWTSTHCMLPLADSINTGIDPNVVCHTSHEEDGSTPPRFICSST